MLEIFMLILFSFQMRRKVKGKCLEIFFTLVWCIHHRYGKIKRQGKMLPVEHVSWLWLKMTQG